MKSAIIPRTRPEVIKMSPTKVSIIILNWNGLEDTIECLESLKKITYPNYEVIVIDNGSEGNDTQVLEERFGDYIYLIKNDKNYGAGGGFNIGMRYFLDNSDADYLLMLDNDIIVDSEFLTEMVKVVGDDSAIGIASAMVYHYDEPDRLHFGEDKVDLWKMDYYLTLGLIIKVIRQKIFRRKDIYRGQYDSIKKVEHIGLWCSFFKRRSVENIGLLTDEFFGFEPIEYFIRVKEAGYKVVYVLRAKVWHKFRSTKRMDGVLQYKGYRDLFRCMKKYATQWQYRCFLIQFFAVHFWLSTAYYLIWHHRPRVLLSFYKGVKDGLFNAKESLKGEG